MVEQMGPGSVVVDLAAESGGNVEGSLPGQVVRVGHAQVWGGANVPAQMPGPASRLYAQNIVNLVTLMTRSGGDGEAAPSPPTSTTRSSPAPASPTTAPSATSRPASPWKETPHE